ncbi:MAG: tRNA (5-methylaminomethyl-2-thiouridine)(34)-methyltransferase MnmD [Bacteroidetes bacterium]|uniref:tRNA (5-methylaminomethyl-2-thiouridine)(34)-methyltransferase MnmD n=1 Tax=Candidatus Gallipaludibacter merdavium TaxID=2840839 RepID=A0A9D9N541_9BACT|nr:tRNA (5-methylaminomethyl-2-thiouridine)(34)-methyltransferase MnmD [Candidatus Gallipaludibacter merdavium]
MERQIVLTEDGSSTLYVSEIDECYHSSHGAIQESEHIFIKAALEHHASKRLSVLEVGFGSGLNALLTLRCAKRNNLTIRYTGIEKYPLTMNEVGQLNYACDDQDKEIFMQMHSLSFGVTASLTPYFSLCKLHTDFVSVDLSSSIFDIVYMDAFSPEKQPELWTQDSMKRLYDSMRIGGILTTYCAKGYVRRNLQSVGFEVERLPGPPGKREMLRATKR